MTTVVEELMLHNRTCPQCGAGEPCLVAEHIQDLWPLRVASQAHALLTQIASYVEEQPVATPRVKVPQYSRFG
jgi:ribosomal protein S27AE